MNEQALISVIIPVYNVEKYLRECVDSVLAQTYKNLEIILVNDGSTDSSGDICNEYENSDNRIRVIHKGNGGASTARNIGIKEAKGEYIYFLDSDDWLDNTAFEQMFIICDKEQADFVYFDAYAVDETTGKISKKYYSHKNEYKTGEGHQIMKELLANKEFHVTPWSMFFSKSFLEQANISFEEGIVYEDLLFSYKVFCEAKKVAYVPQYLYFRRYRENSVMTSKVIKKNFDSAVKVYMKVSDYSAILDKNIKSDAYIIRCAYNALTIYGRLDETDRKACYEQYKQLKQDIIENQAYGDTALKLRCYNKLFWLIYKILIKGMNRIFQRG